MGLGKTFQALVITRELKAEKILIVCPNQVKETWKEEAKNWVKLDFEIDTLGASKLIINYEKLISIGFKDYVQKVDWDLVIFDEAHKLKNVNSKRRKAALELSKKIENILLLTGTPSYNRPDDLYSLLNLCSPNRFPRKKDFIGRYLEYEIIEIRKRWYNPETNQSGIKKIPIVKVTGIRDKKLFKEDTQDILIRRKREEVLPDLPKKQIVHYWVDLTQEQKDLQTQAEADLVLELEKEKINLPNVLTRINRLRQIAVSPFLISDTLEYLYSPKVDALIELFEDYETKLFCFTKFKRAVELTEILLKKKGIKTYKITGDIKLDERQRILDKFEKTSKPAILIGTIDSLGLGLNLQSASHIAVFLDLDFTPSLNQQQEDRIARIGQTKKPIIIRILARDSIDLYVVAILKEKKSLSEEILKGNTIKYLTYQHKV